MGKNKNVRTSNKQYKEAMNNQIDTENIIYMALRQVCLSMFEWKDLPKSMDARKLELDLFNKGSAAGLDTLQYGKINTGVAAGGYVNIYGIPTNINCWAYDFYEKRRLYSGLIRNEKGEILNDRYSEAVLIMNNLDRLPSTTICEYYAKRLADAQLSIDCNVNAQKTPILLLCGENEVLTMRNLYAQYNGNEPVIFGDKNSNVSHDSIKAINTEAPYVVDKLVEYKKELWNEFLTRIGVNNIQTEKKERLIKDEANQNNELINLNLQYFFKTRKTACEQMNELFGTNISVRVSSDLYNVIKQTESIITGKMDTELKNKVEEMTGDENE